MSPSLEPTAKDGDYTQAQSMAMKKIENMFTIDSTKLKEIQVHFMKEMRKGLDQPGQTVAMIPSYVEGRLTGNETGTFLALDLGGTNLRVVRCELKGNGEFASEHSKYKLSEELKTGDARALFDFIAECVDSFLTEHNLDSPSEKLPLGFTFSFPVKQTRINRGNLMSWTKGYSAAGLVNRDPVIMLQDALHKRHLPVEVAALVNDTVGTLLAFAYKHPDCMTGVILGTGSNAAYIENMDRIKKWDGGPVTADEMIINMECGAFDNERVVLPLTRYDNKLDRESINATLEKAISGMYLGEISRNVIIHLIDQDLLFDGRSSRRMNTQWDFETSYMSSIESDTTPTLEETRKFLEGSLEIPSTTFADRKMVRRICELVGARSARLSAAMIAGILEDTGAVANGKIASVGIDGSLYEFYPDYAEKIYVGLEELLGSDIRQRAILGLAKDGSGVGAALVACVATKIARRKSEPKVLPRHE